MKSGYDIIGDVHGCADKLEELLRELGYSRSSARTAYRHASRQAIFVGDLIDRGPSQLRVLEIVKGMVDEGSAQMVMGNHEFNALAYATLDPETPGEFLRPHNEKNIRQHQAFLEQLSDDERKYYLGWFQTIPLWLDLGELRVIHACWHQPSITLIERSLGGNVFPSTEHLIAASRATAPSSPLYEAVEVILKGPELDLQKYGADTFQDKDKILRSKARVKWWHSHAVTLRDLAEVPKGSLDAFNQPYGALPNVRVDDEDRSYSYDDSIPVIYGHYWRAGVPMEHEDWTRLTACVDFSAVKGGTMVAYRWSGERQIDPLHYHPHGTRLVSATPSM
jgi:hypothetical protein